MKKLLSVVLVFVLFLGLLIPTYAQKPEKQQYLVQFEGKINRGILKAFGVSEEEILHTYDLLPLMLLELSENQAKGLANNPHIKALELNAEAYALEQTTPWGITHVEGIQAHQAGYTGQGIKVAILDTGIDNTHPDLALNVKGGYSVFTDTANSNPYNDGDGHGTHVAGTVAAVNNSQGVIGVAYSADLYAVKVLDNSGSGTYAGIAQGIEWAVNNGMQIINMSLGGSTSSTILENMCNTAYDSGILLVAAAGNSGKRNGRGDNVGYPAKYASVMAVAAIDSNNNRATFSSTGPAVEIAAPGVSILSTVPGGQYASYNGTSMASPHVAGVAALVLGARPQLTNVELRNILNSSATYLGTPEHFGNGLVQALKAINYDASQVTNPEPEEPTTPTKPGKGNNK